MTAFELHYTLAHQECQAVSGGTETSVIVGRAAVGRRIQKPSPIVTCPVALSSPRPRSGATLFSDKLIDGGPARLNPRPGRVLDRRMWLTFALRRAKIVKRREVLRDLRAGKLPQ
jgi:hypothetical protein